jgi:hypothetical protein
VAEARAPEERVGAVGRPDVEHLGAAPAHPVGDGEDAEQARLRAPLR